MQSHSHARRAPPRQAGPGRAGLGAGRCGGGGGTALPSRRRRAHVEPRGGAVPLSSRCCGAPACAAPACASPALAALAVVAAAPRVPVPGRGIHPGAPPGWTPRGREGGSAVAAAQEARGRYRPVCEALAVAGAGSCKRAPEPLAGSAMELNAACSCSSRYLKYSLALAPHVPRL